MKKTFLLFSFLVIAINASAGGLTHTGLVAKALFGEGQIFRRDISDKLRNPNDTEQSLTSAVSIVKNSSLTNDRLDMNAGYCQEITTFKSGSEPKVSYLCTLDTEMTDNASILPYRLYRFK